MPRSAASKNAGGKCGLRLLVGAGAAPGPAAAVAGCRGDARRRLRGGRPEGTREEPHVRAERQEPRPRTRIDQLAQVPFPDPRQLPVSHLRDLVDAAAFDGDRQPQRDQAGDAAIAAARQQAGDGAAAEPADHEALHRVVLLHPVERVPRVVHVAAERDRPVEVGEVGLVDLAFRIAQPVEVEAEDPVALRDQRLGQLVVKAVRGDARLDARREQHDRRVAAAICRRVDDADEALAPAVRERHGMPFAHAAASSQVSVASNSRGAAP